MKNIHIRIAVVAMSIWLGVAAVGANTVTTISLRGGTVTGYSAIFGNGSPNMANQDHRGITFTAFNLYLADILKAAGITNSSGSHSTFSQTPLQINTL